MSLADLGDLPAIAEKIAAQARAGRTVVVTAPTGAGRWSLLGPLGRAVNATGGSVVEVRLPAFDALDAAVHGVLQLAAARGASAMSAARDASRPLQQRARELALETSAAGATLVVHVPESWQHDRRLRRPGMARRQTNAAALFDGWFGEPRAAGAVLLLHPRSRHLLDEVDRTGFVEQELPVPQARRDALEDASTWGAYGSHAKAVLATREVSLLDPIQLRLLVGVVALGGNAADTAAALWRGPHSLIPLLDEIEVRLGEPRHVAVATAVRRFLQARYPLPREVALRVAGCPDEHEPLLTECLAYGHEGELRVPDAIRRRLRGPYSENWNAAHLELAHHHKALDGAVPPPSDRRTIVHWLEKAHHLGRSGALGAREWQELAPELGPEHLLDRARALSIVDHDYTGAAALYQACVKRDPCDAYAWHYLGFNLQRMDSRSADAETAYRKAVDIEPSNPWWNSRLVTFLIDDLRYAAAEEEWRQAAERRDATNRDLDAWYPRHVHRWVVRTWLAHGEIARASAVFRTIPRAAVKESPALLQLEQEVADAVEGVTLGESIYPAHVPVASRWETPIVLADTLEDQPLVDWMPGRVVDVSGIGAHVVVATLKPRRVFSLTISNDEWRSWASGSPRVDEFFEMGFYGEQKSIVAIRELKATRPKPVGDDEDDSPMSWSTH